MGSKALCIQYDKDEDGIVRLTIDMQGPVNIMNKTFFEDFAKTVVRLEKDDITGVILLSGKDTFFTGGDLTELREYQKENAEEIFNNTMVAKQMARRFEQLGKPIVAGINGTALGGGFELCLSCHHRIVIDDPNIQIGFPEVTLGLLPGFGGVVRSIHLIGAQVALPILMEGKSMKPQQVVGVGLIDELAEDSDNMINKATQWIKENPDAKQSWDKPNHFIPGGDLTNPDTVKMISAAPAFMFKKSKGAYPAPEEILNVATQTLNVDFDTALRAETRSFVKLATSDIAKNMINTFFFQLKEVRAGKSRPSDIDKQTTKKIGVIGAGMMGRGIALVSARAGIDVVLKDVSMEAAEQGKIYCEKRLEGKPNKEKVLDRIIATDNVDVLQGCDLIIEAVFEDVELKHNVTKESEAMLVEGGVFASNTSTLPITLLSEATSKPENFIGIHFFSPVEKMALIEIIVGEKTSDETLAKAYDFALQIRKTPIVVNDSRGFFTSRVIITYLDEAIKCLVEGVNPVRIERLAALAGFPVGPLALMDELSQRLMLEIANTNADLNKRLDTQYGDTNKTSLEVCEQFVQQFDRGGKAYGGGFYEYPEGEKKHIWPKLFELYFKKDYEISDEDIQQRLLFRQIVESIRCLEEGVINHSRDANIGSIFGIGFPPPTGGVLQFVNTFGAKKFADRLNQMAEKYGECFTPPNLLVEKAKINEIF